MSVTSQTRRIYRIERTWVYEEWPMRKLRRLAKKIWEGEGVKWKMPRIVAGRGMRYNGRCTSYCQERDLIVIARHHRDPKVLIHEIAHAIVGVWHNHDAVFEKKMVELLTKYRIKIHIKPRFWKVYR